MPLIAGSVGYNNQAFGQQAQCHERLLSIVKAVILERYARPRKYLFGVLEAQAVLSEVSAVLRFLPLVFHF